MNIVYSVEQVNATTSCLFPKLTYFYNCYITEKHGGIIVHILGGKLEKKCMQFSTCGSSRFSEKALLSIKLRYSDLF